MGYNNEALLDILNDKKMIKRDKRSFKNER